MLSLMHKNTSVAELSSTISKFHAVILVSIKPPKQPQASSLKAQFTKTPRDRHDQDPSHSGFTSDLCSVKASGKRSDFVTSTCELGCLPPPASTDGHTLEWVPGNTLSISQQVFYGEYLKRIGKWGKAKQRESGIRATKSL